MAIGLVVTEAPSRVQGAKPRKILAKLHNFRHIFLDFITPKFKGRHCPNFGGATTRNFGGAMAPPAPPSPTCVSEGMGSGIYGRNKV